MSQVSLHPLDRAGVRRAQSVVTARHYLHRPVDPRCAVEGYAVHVLGVYGDSFADPEAVGYLLVGRPEATACYPWYGSVADVQSVRAACSRWAVLNLARVWLDPVVQQGGAAYTPAYLPGFTDRRGTWRSALGSTVLGLLAARVAFDYLTRRPPCFLDEPYAIEWLLSYQAPLHRGILYQTAGWERYRSNERGLVTWRLALPALTPIEDRLVRAVASVCARSQGYRARRVAAATVRQLSFGDLPCN